MNAQELWEEFCEKHVVDKATPYESWAFCGGGPSGDNLAQLVLCGIKFGTASPVAAFGEEEPIPKEGDYSVILLDSGEAACVLRDYDVSIVPFSKVTYFHGYAEGEEERTDVAWRKIHEHAFAPDLKSMGMQLTDDTLIVCEKFCVEYISDSPAVRELMTRESLRHNYCAPPADFDFEKNPSMGELAQEVFYVEPCQTYEKQIEEYRKELMNEGGDSLDCLSLAKCVSVEKWIKDCRDYADPSLERAANCSPVSVIMCVRKADKKIVGMLQIVHDNSMEQIDCFVCASERKKGYDEEMLRHAADFCKAYGIKENES